jgi:hypothetical protein
LGGFFSKYQKVDFFNYKTNFLEWNGIKIQDPFDIIKRKSNIILESDILIVKEKHSIDLMIVAESIINDRSVDRIESHKVPSFCLEY